jgi:hypothetical protein
MRSGYCEVEMHKHCEAKGLIECACRCHHFQPIVKPDVHGALFGISRREDGQAVLMVEDDEFYHPIGSFSLAWLKDLARVAAEAAAKFGDHESTASSR